MLIRKHKKQVGPYFFKAVNNNKQKCRDEDRKTPAYYVHNCMTGLERDNIYLCNQLSSGVQ